MTTIFRDAPASIMERQSEINSIKSDIAYEAASEKAFKKFMWGSAAGYWTLGYLLKIGDYGINHATTKYGLELAAVFAVGVIAIL